jgi:hypothetical protein
MEEKLKNVFEKEYSENKLIDFLIKTQKVYEFFGYDFNLKPIRISPSETYGGKIWLNEDYANSAVSNLEIITFTSVYPKLISKLAETNLERFNEVYSNLLEIYHSDRNIGLKKYINMSYGCLGSPKCEIHSNNIHLVPKVLHKMLNDILSEFKGNIVYIDTDQIFFRNFDGVRERFEKYFNLINKYELTYFSEKSKFGLFVSGKRYIIEENGNITVRGLKHFSKEGMSRGGFIDMIGEAGKIEYKIC